jgi:hypothetical protein
MVPARPTSRGILEDLLELLERDGFVGWFRHSVRWLKSGQGMIYGNVDSPR